MKITFEERLEVGKTGKEIWASHCFTRNGRKFECLAIIHMCNLKNRERIMSELKTLITDEMNHVRYKNLNEIANNTWLIKEGI